MRRSELWPLVRDIELSADQGQPEGVKKDKEGSLFAPSKENVDAAISLLYIKAQGFIIKNSVHTLSVLISCSIS